MELSNEEKQVCQQYVKDNPECNVGEVLTEVFGESTEVLTRAAQILAIIRYLLSLNES